MRDTIFCVFSVLTTLVLAIVSLRYVTDFYLLSFFYSFQVHLAAAAAAASVAALLVKRHWYAVVTLCVSVVLAAHGVVMMREFVEPAVEESRPALFKLMSFNIENDNFANGADIADMVIASGADVVSILEAEPLLSQLPRLLKTYPYYIGCGAGMQECDTLVLSKRPLIEPRIRNLGLLWRNRLTISAIDFDGQKVNFLAAHLTKPYYDEFHGLEIEDLAEIIPSLPGPLVLAGDFNTSILAPDVQYLMRSQGLGTVSLEPATWPIAAGAFGIPIDHIFSRAPLRLKSVRRIENSFGSNHFGLMAEFAIDP
ncbi:MULTISPECIES: endonuclease/exonuclease/phosphatase family protein [unclassified Rhizobium]|uniref:endonuclease/exonuclease/phosphatase family protein n=1 Tax=unclassified Rhizobium TaxID=2613769 RepID=UPI0007E9F261|nr:MULTISPECIES: endonuclease/exonuclease/phosphatase family protein [unclassified Rhizobium]ANM11606.1 endonuclease/exonuclease/phosphatase family protein [Rhizobium sp. N324]ANM18079.1 endonuclease/exonuclease/phosphatase family protein [Rhizobium sp. N541]ANM24465.1 endonuclease/exonuclease/phosphatase family protein [Rhizobium sp. N941]OYD05211.1 endonuclease/exonuclease/phosphatase family protein [Rhizobium sp. N4311]